MWYIDNYIIPLSFLFIRFWERERERNISPRVRLSRFVLSLESLIVFDFSERLSFWQFQEEKLWGSRECQYEFFFFDDEDSGFGDNWRRFGDGPLSGYAYIHVFIPLGFVSDFLCILMHKSDNIDL